MNKGLRWHQRSRKWGVFKPKFPSLVKGKGTGEGMVRRVEVCEKVQIRESRDGMG